MSARMLLRGGMVADGIGTTTQRADVLIDGQRIAAITGDGITHADCEIVELAPGSVICPGFIDAHVHAEGPLLTAGRVDGALVQGVTTLVVGQDGQSWIGGNSKTVRYLNQYFAAVNGVVDPVRDLSVAAYRDAVSGRLTQNVAVLASQGTIRHNVAGMKSGHLSPSERAAARRQVEEALAEGAVGLSSGFDYLPSRFGSVDEVTDMARPLAAADRPYVSHLRGGYGADVKAGLDELLAVGRAADTRVHASHLWGTPADIEAAFGDADVAGVGVTYDMYPFRRSSTILAALLLPADVQAQGPEHTLAALTSPQQRVSLLKGEKFTETYLQSVSLGCVPDDVAEFAGCSVAEAAKRSSQSPGEWVLDLLVHAELNVGAHLERPTLGEDELAWLDSSDRHCAGSDGIYQGQHPHPRGYAAFARLAEHYLAAGPSTGYQQLARHLAASAADIYGLRERGRLAPGMAADICVVRPGGMAAHATYDAPQQAATGVHLVIVNGTIVWMDDRPVTMRFPGQLVT